MMARIWGRRLPPECVQCGKSALGVCPHHMGEGRNSHTSRRLVRGLRRLLPIDGALPDGRSLPPDVVILVPTLRCNLKCPYCFQRNESSPAWRPQQEDRLSLAEWQAVIAEIKPLGPHGHHQRYRTAPRRCRIGGYGTEPADRLARRPA
jgi:hypothetical protein